MNIGIIDSYKSDQYQNKNLYDKIFSKVIKSLEEGKSVKLFVAEKLNGEMA